MIRKIILAAMVLSLVSSLGCEELSSLTQEGTETSNLKILKAEELGAQWEMKQMSFKVGADDEVLILLKLSDGDEVDGYFYLEKGDDIDFRITGKTLLYRSPARDGKVSSDRFSFVASQAQGDTYALPFHNPRGDNYLKTTITVFLEVIFPVSGSVFVPVEGE